MKKLALAAAVLAAAPLAQADLIFTVGAKASIWDAEPTGQIDKGLSVESDGLNLKSKNGQQYTLYFEHLVPLVPNVKLKQTSLEVKGNGTATTSFAGKSFDGAVASTIDVSHTDATVYWQPIFPVPKVNIDVGLTARMFDGDASVTGESNNTETSKSVDLDLTLPMVYAGVQVGPIFGVYANADVNWIGVGDNKLTDISATLGYNLPLPIPFVDVGLEAGYRSFNLQTDKKDVDVDADLDIGGLFYGLSAKVGF